MDQNKIKSLLNDFRQGRLSEDELLELLKRLPYKDLGFARLDTHRALRKGVGEIVFCRNKTLDHSFKIIKHLSEHNNVFATHAQKELYEKLRSELDAEVHYNELAGTLTVVSHPESVKKKDSLIYVISAGTSDIPVAEEAAETARFLGCEVETVYDVGVAGVHRFFDELENFEKATALIVVAGMDGVLPSMLGGLVSRPVIAVPTSVGYGASFQGLAPLLTMLNSCAPGVAVMNIDNGFGAGYFAAIL